MTNNNEAYQTVIADFEAEAAEIEARLREITATIKSLRKRTVTMVHIDTPPAPRPVQLSQPSPRGRPARSGHGRKKKGDTAVMVLDFVKRRGGLTSIELANELAPMVAEASSATNPRKLVHSTLGYLRDDRKTLRKDEDGRYYAV